MRTKKALAQLFVVALVLTSCGTSTSDDRTTALDSLQRDTISAQAETGDIPVVASTPTDSGPDGLAPENEVEWHQVLTSAGFTWRPADYDPGLGEYLAVCYEDSSHTYSLGLPESVDRYSSSGDEVVVTVFVHSTSTEVEAAMDALWRHYVSCPWSRGDGVEEYRPAGGGYADVILLPVLRQGDAAVDDPTRAELALFITSGSLVVVRSDDAETAIRQLEKSVLTPIEPAKRDRPATGWLADAVGGPEFPGDPAYITDQDVGAVDFSPEPDYGEISPTKIATAIHTAWTGGAEAIDLLDQYDRAAPSVTSVMRSYDVKSLFLAPSTCAMSSASEMTCEVTVLFAVGGNETFLVSYLPEKDWFITSVGPVG